MVKTVNKPLTNTTTTKITTNNIMLCLCVINTQLTIFLEQTRLQIARVNRYKV